MPPVKTPQTASGLYEKEKAAVPSSDPTPATAPAKAKKEKKG